VFVECKNVPFPLDNRKGEVGGWAEQALKAQCVAMGVWVAILAYSGQGGLEKHRRGPPHLSYGSDNNVNLFTIYTCIYLQIFASFK